MKKNKLLMAIGAAVLIGIVLLLAYKSQNQEASDDVIRVGAILPLTGKHADAGNSIRVGLEFAKRKLDEESGRNHKVYYFDTKSDPKDAITGYRMLKDTKGVKMFFTTISENGLAIKPAILRDGGLLFAILSHVDILSNRDGRVFRFLQTGEDEANFMSDYIVDKLAAKRIALFVFNAEAGISFKNTFVKRLGEHIIGLYDYEESPESIKALVSTANLHDADCVVVVGYSPSMGNVIKQIRQIGYKKEIVANIGFNNPSILAAAGDAVSSVWFNDYDLPYGTKNHDELTSRAKSEYNTPFTSLSYIAYGAMGLMDSACKSDNGKVEDMIKEYFNSNATNCYGGVKFVIHPDGRVITGLKMTSFSK